MTPAARMQFHHVPVMPDEVLAALAPKPGELFVDCTLGGGGHARMILEAADCRVIGLDRDPDALANAASLVEAFGDRFVPVRAPFSELGRVLADRGEPVVDGIFADLGVSSHQLDTAERGFSFRARGPIDMRMDPDSGVPAAELVNQASVEELARILRDFGEERQARRVAAAIVDGRPWSDTLALAEGIARALGPAAARGRIHPATRSFQALRIAVNGELAELEALLSLTVPSLRPGGRLAILTFHSLEDRLVKRFLDASSGKGRPRDPYGNPIGPVHLRVSPDLAPSPSHQDGNPRARSARLRSATRLPSPGQDSPWNAPSR